MNTEFIALSAIINFPKGIIEEHTNTFLERKNNPLFSHQFHDDSEESDTDKQYSSQMTVMLMLIRKRYQQM